MEDATTSKSLDDQGHTFLYQILHHACYLPDEPQDESGYQLRQQQQVQGSRIGPFFAGLRDWVWTRRWGIKTTDHANYVRSIAVSASGRLIAVLNQAAVTILTEADGFREPTGIYKGSGYYVHGVWIDGIDILAVQSNTNAIILLDSKGNELQIISIHKQAAREDIAGMFPKCMPGKYTRYGLVVLTSGCAFHVVGISHNGVEKIDQKDNWGHVQHALRKQHAHGVSCLYFNSEHSILTLAGPTAEAGRCCLSLWRVADSLSSIQLLHCVNHLSGFLSEPWYSTTGSARIRLPKLIVSNNMKYVVILDCKGRLHIVCVNQTNNWMLKEVEIFPIECLATPEDSNTKNEPREFKEQAAIYSSSRTGYFTVVPMEQVSRQGKTHSPENLFDVRDVSWWSDDGLVLLKENGQFDIVLVPELNSFLVDRPIFFGSNVHVVRGQRKHIFLLVDISSAIMEKPKELLNAEQESSHLISTERREMNGWRLISLLEYAVAEMYEIFIECGNFELALEIASEYNLDADDVYKARWLSSDYGREALQQSLQKIQDISWVLNECLDKVSPDVETMKDVLQYGLYLTDCNRKVDNGGNIVNSVLIDDFSLIRLRILQYKDRLETFLGLSMGRFFPKDYTAFRSSALKEYAIRFAEGAKIGALYLLYKRHLYSLAPYILKILESIPETVSPHDYGHLLPQLSAPQVHVSIRDEDWIEKEEMLDAIKKYSEQRQQSMANISESTERMVKLLRGFDSPSKLEIVQWYETRARVIDKVSGQLENSLTLLDLGLQKGFKELEPLWEDASDLYRVVYGGIGSDNRISHFGLSDWEQISDYEKFRVMLTGVNELNVLERLRGQAVPFMNRRCKPLGEGNAHMGEDDNSLKLNTQLKSFLVTWLEEVAKENQLKICTAVINEACKSSQDNWLFKDKLEIAEVALICIYSCTMVDQWELMASMLSKLVSPTSRSDDILDHFDHCSFEKGADDLGNTARSSCSGKSVDSKMISMKPIFLTPHDDSFVNSEVHSNFEHLQRKVREAEGHVEAGSLLSLYQVAKPIKFFIDAKSDQNGVKQLLRLLLSKYARRQPTRSDAEWAVMWNDMQTLQAKAFPYLDIQFLFTEYFRGVLKAGKFSLARTQLKSTGKHILAAGKAEKVVIQVAREYFYSASSLESSEIVKARQCLNIFPESKVASAEMGLIDAVTVKLPALGVFLLPMQVKQVRDPMDIVKMALSNKVAAYLKVDELMDIARLLGLSSSDQLAMVEAAIAREAAASGDLNIAMELCIVLLKKNYGSIWDLGVALARGPSLKGLDLELRKELLGFALSHCDDDSVGELLNAWKDLDLTIQCINLRATSGEIEAGFSEQETSVITASGADVLKRDLLLTYHADHSECVRELGVRLPQSFREVLPKVTRNFSIPGISDWDTFQKDRKKLVCFSCLELPWLLRISGTNWQTSLETRMEKAESSVQKTDCSNDVSMFVRECSSISSQAVSIILYGLATNDVLPSDELICCIAQAAMGKWGKGERDVYGCGYLLNLSDPCLAVKAIEGELEKRGKYPEACQIMKTGLIFSSLQDAALGSREPRERTNKLHKVMSTSDFPTITGCSDDDQKTMTGSRFWTSWHVKVMQRLNIVEQTVELGKVIHGIEMERFIEHDEDYIRSTILAFVSSVKTRKESRISQGLELATFFGVDKCQVLMEHFIALLTSVLWVEDEIRTEISTYWGELSKQPTALIRLLRTNVYPELDGTKKARLSCFYNVLSDFYTILEVENGGCTDMPPTQFQDVKELICYYKVLAQESCRVSFIEDLNFKHIAGLDDLNYGHAFKEVCQFMDESNVENLIKMVQNLGELVRTGHSGNHFPTSCDVCRTYLEKNLILHIQNLELGEHWPENVSPIEDDFLSVDTLWRKYTSCQKFLHYLSYDDQWNVVQKLLQGGCRIIQEIKEHGNGLHTMQDFMKNTMCSMLNLWVTAIQDVRKWVDRELDDNQERKCLLQSLANLAIFCDCFQKLIQGGTVRSLEGWRVIAKMKLLSDSKEQIVCFLESMITAGCSLEAVLTVFHGILEDPADILVHPSRNSQNFENVGGNLQIELLNSTISEVAKRQTENELHQDMEAEPSVKQKMFSAVLAIYLLVVNSALEAMAVQSKKDDASTKKEALVKVVASLQSMSGSTWSMHHEQIQLTELLSEIRNAVWNKMIKFVENIYHPSYMRVCVLELLESNAGGKTDVHQVLENDGDGCSVSWDGWSMTDFSNQNPHMFSKGILSALRSTQIISQAWPNVDVRAENLSSPYAMTSFFEFLAAKADLPQHMSLLKVLLEEWSNISEPEINSVCTKNREAPNENIDVHDAWGEGEDWGDGWEDFGETRRHVDIAASEAGCKVNVLHSCWRTVLQGLSLNTCLEEVLETLDKYRLKEPQLLLTEDEAIELVASIAKKEPISALKVSLLLPYNLAWNIGLSHYEKKLKSMRLSSENCTYWKHGEDDHGTVSREVDSSSVTHTVPWVDNSLLILILSSSFLSHIAEDTNSLCTFSTLCAAMMLSTQDVTSSVLGCICQEEQCFMRQVVFPYFIAELTRIRHYYIAGGLVLKYMRVHFALCTLNAGYAALKTFLEAQFLSVKENPFILSSNHADIIAWKKLGSLQYLPSTIQTLQNRLECTLTSALEVISKDSL